MTWLVPKVRLGVRFWFGFERAWSHVGESSFGRWMACEEVKKKTKTREALRTKKIGLCWISMM